MVEGRSGRESFELDATRMAEVHKGVQVQVGLLLGLVGGCRCEAGCVIGWW